MNLLLACCSLVLVGVVAISRRAERAQAGALVQRGYWLALGLAVTFGIGISAWQLWVPETRATYARDLTEVARFGSPE